MIAMPATCSDIWLSGNGRAKVKNTRTGEFDIYRRHIISSSRALRGSAGQNRFRHRVRGRMSNFGTLAWARGSPV